MKYLEILNLFDKDQYEEIQDNQNAYIRSLDDMLMKLTILETRNEKEAEPELNYIINFYKYLLQVDYKS